MKGGIKIGLFSEFPSGRPTPFTAIHKGVEYPGEVILTESWQPELGEITGDVHFRIVILSRHQGVPRELIRERRIALLAPSLTLRERGEGYHTGADLEIKGDAESYAAGSILTYGVSIDPGEVFSTTESDRILTSIATILLANARPSPPIDSSLLGRAVRYSDAGDIFKGFFVNPDDPWAKMALDDIAPALGLSRPRDPRKLDISSCPVFDIIGRRLDEVGGIAVPKLYRELSEEFALTWPLITLYLLCFVYWQIPAVEVSLNPSRKLFLRTGESLIGGRLTSSLVPYLWWGSGMEGAFERLYYSTEHPWNSILPYASLICPDLRPVEEGEELDEQERLLIQGLEGLKRAISQNRATLDLLRQRLGESPDRGALSGLERLSRIARAKGYQDFFSSAREEYPLVKALADDLSLLQCLSRITEFSPEVVEVKSYLDRVTLRKGDEELEMDRISILEGINLQNLIASPHLWPSMKALFDWFRSRYSSAYLTHHQDYHQKIAALRDVLEASRPEVEALRRLNSIAELGGPLGEKLFDDYEELLRKVVSCPLRETGEVSVDLEPTCASCGLELREEPPVKEVERFLKGLEGALRKQQRRLSSEAIRQILAQSGNERVDQFIKIVQTSDLSPLVNVMDEEMVGFLRTFLTEGKR